jgi:hypothetical protein
MKRSVMLTIACLLSIFLLLLHVTDDIARGVETAGPANLIVLAVLAFLLYGTLVLAERRLGYITSLIVGIAAAGMPAIHLRAAGMVNMSKPGSYFFLFTLFALGVLGGFAIILSVRGLLNPQWGQSR